jgi:alpha-D-xyloside xylohydrolase
VDVAAQTIRLSRGETELLAIRNEHLSVGWLERLDLEKSFVPTVFFSPDGLVVPPPVVWRVPVAWQVAEASAQRAVVQLDYGDGLEGQLELRADPQLSVHWTASAQSGVAAFYRLGVQVDPQEGIYGFGEHFDEPNSRGRVRPMQIEVDFGLEAGYNEVHVPIPLGVGTRGWGVYVQSDQPGAFDVARSAPDLLQAAFFAGLPPGEGLRFYLFARETALDVYADYFEVTGAPALPPRWALGPLVWRDENVDQAEVESDAQIMRELDLAVTGMWVDRPYAVGVNTFDFEFARFPDPEGLVSKLRDLGIPMGLWHTPYLDSDDPATAPLLALATARGYYPEVAGPKLNPWGPLLDLTNPEAVAWWQENLRPYIDLGVVGFKLDYAEDVIPGALGVANPWRFSDGSTELTAHQTFQMSYHTTYYDLFDEQPFLLCRAATAGSHRLGVVIWPGDLDSTFGKHREDYVDRDGDEFKGVGGLPAAVVAGTSLASSGFSFFGSDTGGYKHGPPDNELFSRWFEHTAFWPVMQVGTGSSEVAWEFDEENGFDDAMLQRYRAFTREHLRLFPYLWTYAHHHKDTGRPIARPLGLAHPELGVHPTYDYTLGDWIYVYPVVERGASTRSVLLPPGRYVDWWTGQWVEGGQSVEVPAPIGTIPVYLREGGIVPRLRPTIDALMPAKDSALVDSAAAQAGPLWVRVAPGAETAMVLFDGTTIGQSYQEGALTLEYAEGSEYVGPVLFEIIGVDPLEPAGGSEGLAGAADLAALEKSEAGYWYDPQLRTLWVKLPGAGAVEFAAP